jgi:hypothetical protein
MNIRFATYNCLFITALHFIFLFSPYDARAQYTGGDGRGDFSILKTLCGDVPTLQISENSGVPNDGFICGGSTTVTLTVSGCTSYTWSTGSASTSISVNPQATTSYTVTATSSTGCTSTVSRTVSIATIPVVSVVSQTDVSCNGASNGSITLSVSGGNGALVYAWSNMSATSNPTGLPAGTYTVTVTDSYNCESTASVVISEPAVLTPGLTSRNLCTGFVNGVVRLSPSGGVAPYSFLWSNSSTTKDLTGLGTGSYTVTVTDANNCTMTASATLTSGPPPSPLFFPGESSGIQNNDGDICAGATVGLSADQWDIYSWSEGSTSQTINVAPACTSAYSVTASDSYGCVSTGSFSINVKKEPKVSSLNPASGTTGTTVTLTGQDLDQVTAVQFDGIPGNNLTLISPSQLTVSLPGSSMQLITVVSACGNSVLLNSTPVVAAFSPVSGSAGTIVTLTGSNLDKLVSAQIGGTSAVIIERNAGTAKLVVMPGTISGAISVASPVSTATAAGSFTVSTTPCPNLQQGSKQASSVINTLMATSVAISADGNTAVVGGPGDASNKGAVWVYTRNGSSWSLQSKLVGTGATGASRQGTSVSVSSDGNTVASGGPGDNGNKGAAWVFVRSGAVWNQQGSKLTGTGASGPAQQGTSVCLSGNGNTLAVGGIADNSYAGAVWTFERYENQWAQIGEKLTGAGATGKARQGASIGLTTDGTSLIWGGYQDNNRQGAVWIFARNGCTWNQQGGKLVGTGGSTQAWQGIAVSISADGNTILSGGSTDNSLTGATWIFTFVGGTWTQQARLTGTQPGGASRQGSAVSISADGSTVLIGGMGDESNKGALWAFVKSGSSWVQQGVKVRGTGATGPAKQGTSLSVSANGATAILGGPSDNNNRGGFWIFTPATGALTEPHIAAEDREITGTAFRLDQNLPNPFAGQTTITFSLPEACTAEWEIADAAGRVIRMLVRDYPAGENQEVFDLSGYSGICYCRLKTPAGMLTRKMIVEIK